MRQAALLLVAAASITGCGGRQLAPEEIPWLDVEEADQGIVCLGTPDLDSISYIGAEPHRFEVGEDLALQFDAARCFPVGCEPIEDVQVEGVWNDQELQASTLVRSRVTDWERVPPGRSVPACPLNCNWVTHVVPVEPIGEPGTYTLRWAGQSVSFDVPGDAFACLATRVSGGDAPETEGAP